MPAATGCLGSEEEFCQVSERKIARKGIETQTPNAEFGFVCRISRVSTLIETFNAVLTGELTWAVLRR